jgi:hypothetical protein
VFSCGTGTYSVLLLCHEVFPRKESASLIHTACFRQISKFILKIQKYLEMTLIFMVLCIKCTGTFKKYVNCGKPYIV